MASRSRSHIDHKRFKIATLALADGTVFKGRLFGAEAATVGEVVFNTSMSGYQEIITDASYHDQIVAFTFPHIGNVGTNLLDVESGNSHVSAIIIKSLSLTTSSWRSAMTLDDYLSGLGIPGISGIDTRKLTRRLREKGSTGGCVLPSGDARKAIRLAKSFKGLLGSKLAQKVSGKRRHGHCEELWNPETNAYPKIKQGKGKPLVAVLDCGAKTNILRMLVDRGLDVVVMPYSSTFDRVIAEKPSGVLISNGPGDPAPCDDMIETVRQLLNANIPLFGICLGAQLLALASGCRTEKMKFGHHGANHPVLDVKTHNVAITSQNHGFAVSRASLPINVKETHHSLFDGSIQGIELKDRPAFAFQGHPEASPGPHDLSPLFDKFKGMILKRA